MRTALILAQSLLLKVMPPVPSKTQSTTFAVPMKVQADVRLRLRTPRTTQFESVPERISMAPVQ